MRKKLKDGSRFLAALATLVLIAGGIPGMAYAQSAPARGAGGHASTARPLDSSASKAADPKSSPALSAADETPAGQPAGLSSHLADSVTPQVPNMVHLVARHADGTVFYDQTVHNLRTNAGINWQYNQMAGTTAAVCTYIALSNDSTAPAATDTSVASEITTNGLARALATPAHTSNATSYTLSYTFTATGTQSAQKAGMLNASSAGTLCFENTFSQVSMNSGDTLAITWTVNF